MSGKLQNGRASGAEPDPITIALRQLHEDVIAEDIPPEFFDLLASIEKKVSDVDGE